MNTKDFAADTVIIQAEEPIEYVALISKGAVLATFPNGELSLKMGDIIGVTDICYGKHYATYTAAEQSTLVLYPCHGPKELSDLVHLNHDYALLFAVSLIRQTCDICDTYTMSHFFSDKLYEYLLNTYDDYKKLCLQYAQPAETLKGLESMKPLPVEAQMEDWILAYYESLKALDMPAKTLIYKNNPDICVELLCRCSRDIHEIYALIGQMNDYNSHLSSLLLNSHKLDLFSMVTNLYVTAAKKGTDMVALDATLSRLSIHLEGNPSIDSLYYKQRLNEYKETISGARLERAASDALEEDTPSAVLKSSTISALSGSLSTILQYADFPEETAEKFRKCVVAFKQLPDKNGDDDTSRKLRHTITSLFYEIYILIFQISITDKNIPPVIKMFLNFGYVDEVLSGIQNSVYLYDLSEDYKADPEHGIYTLYEWLLAVYHGKKEPCRNEFDVDYSTYVHEMKVTGQISEEVERRMLSDTSQKVMYELQNMFPCVNKMTFGRVATFCPVLTEQNILKSPEGCLVTPDKVKQQLNAIRAVDYTAFYHEFLYSNEELKIGREFVHKELLPDVILLPNVGIRGAMWQETEGRSRRTHARMMLPAFCLTDLDTVLIRLTGEYRWEMCKRVQGARWNDVSDPSLTSFYTDYLQFYRKNNELSPQAKEQIKLSLSKAKNNFREAFVRDYLLWMQFEGAGSPRLNKVSRSIFFRFCPFSKQVREELANNPIYSDAIRYFDLKQGQDLVHMEKLTAKLLASGYEVPEELVLEQNYLSL